MSASDDGGSTFASDLVDGEGRLDFGSLAERAVGTIYYGVILGVVGLIEMLSGAISTLLGTIETRVVETIDAIYVGGPESSGVVGAIRAAGSSMDWLLGLLGPVGYPIAVLIGLALGIVVVRATLLAFAIVTGREA